MVHLDPLEYDNIDNPEIRSTIKIMKNYEALFLTAFVPWRAVPR